MDFFQVNLFYHFRINEHICRISTNKILNILYQSRNAAVLVWYNSENNLQYQTVHFILERIWTRFPTESWSFMVHFLSRCVSSRTFCSGHFLWWWGYSLTSVGSVFGFFFFSIVLPIQWLTGSFVSRHPPLEKAMCTAFWKFPPIIPNTTA